jgi:SAM-dependent methyltransferase
MHVGERIRFLHFNRLVNQRIKSPKDILDAGSGNGNYVFHLRKLFPKAKIKGFDVSKEKIHNILRITRLLDLKNMSFHQKSLIHVKEVLKYDLVVCIDVLEHIRNDQVAVRNMKRSLKPGGSLILHVPINRRLAYRHFKRFKDFGIEDHVREEYRVEEIFQKLKGAGLKVKSFSYTQGWFGSLAWEIDQLLIVYFSKIRYIAFPFLYILILADVYIRNKRGNGFLFHCVRDKV